jgi:hypothetical protein
VVSLSPWGGGAAPPPPPPPPPGRAKSGRTRCESVSSFSGVLEELIRRRDGEQVVMRFDQPTGTWMFVCIHSVARGPAGGVLNSAGVETLGWDRETIDARLAGIGDTLGEIYARADAEGITTGAAAERIARARLT